MSKEVNIQADLGTLQLLKKKRIKLKKEMRNLNVISLEKLSQKRSALKFIKPSSVDVNSKTTLYEALRFIKVKT
jgi:hypothetical protein